MQHTGALMYALHRRLRIYRNPRYSSLPRFLESVVICAPVTVYCRIALRLNNITLRVPEGILLRYEKHSPPPPHPEVIIIIL